MEFVLHNQASRITATIATSDHEPGGYRMHLRRDGGTEAFGPVTLYPPCVLVDEGLSVHAFRFMATLGCNYASIDGSLSQASRHAMWIAVTDTTADPEAPSDLTPGPHLWEVQSETAAREAPTAVDHRVCAIPAGS